MEDGESSPEMRSPDEKKQPLDMRSWPAPLRRHYLTQIDGSNDDLSPVGHTKGRRRKASKGKASRN